MSWWWILFAVGLWPFVLAALLVVGLLLFFTGTLGVDGLFAAAERQGTLTCWHCGEETRAGGKTCSQCGGELQ